MAIELRFICEDCPNDFFTVRSHEKGRVTVWINEEGALKNPFTFDIQTAIKLSKTLRTEINKAKEEANNG